MLLFLLAGMRCASADPPAIELPGVYHVLGDQAPGATITMEEISHCIGVSAALRQQASALAPRLAAIQEKASALDHTSRENADRLIRLDAIKGQSAAAIEKLKKN